jgi:hypothetical protein
MSRPSRSVAVRSMTAEKERWAEALAIEQRYRDNAGKQITGRMYAMARAGNVAGVARWMPIAQKLDDLREAPTRPA